MNDLVLHQIYTTFDGKDEILISRICRTFNKSFPCLHKFSNELIVDLISRMKSINRRMESINQSIKCFENSIVRKTKMLESPNQKSTNCQLKIYRYR